LSSIPVFPSFRTSIPIWTRKIRRLPSGTSVPNCGDGVLISSPEYAHGVPGALKNALDWLVRSGELYQKPVALVNASLRSTHAQASLTETLTTMTARLVPESCVTVALPSRNLDSSGTCSDPEVARVLSTGINALARAVAPWPNASDRPFSRA
jgi:NAD(P)H-dependent FMN reductase